MPGRKKGRQRGNAGSKAQRARRWDNALREAGDDLAADRRAKLVRGGDSAPPRLSLQGYRSLATLLTQRVRADRADEVAGMRSGTRPGFAQMGGGPENAAFSSVLVSKSKHDSAVDRNDNRPRRTRSLLSLCMSQMGKDFAMYRSDDDDVAAAFRLLPDACLSRLSRAASAQGTVDDQNIALLCSPEIKSLWLRGRFSDQGAAAILPELLENSDKDVDRPQRQLDGANIEAESHSEGTQTALDTTTNNEKNIHSLRAGGCDAADCGSQDKTDQSDGNTSLSGEEQQGFPSIGGVDGDGAAGLGDGEDWETADDRIQASLRGCVSLTSLDISSTLISAGFVKRLVMRIPSLRRLGLRGSLSVVGGPNAVCDYVPRLTGLRELDVSRCSWFCDLCLRRFATALAKGHHPSSGRRYFEGPPKGIDRATFESMSLQHEDETSSDWGAASARGLSLGLDTHAPSANSNASVRGFHDDLPLDLHGIPLHMSGSLGREARAGKRGFVDTTVPRFRTITVVCVQTAVTVKGAKAAEATAPGLLVLLEEQADITRLNSTL